MALIFKKQESKCMEPEQAEDHRLVCRYKWSDVTCEGRIWLYSNFKNWSKCRKVFEIGST
jgi:hypothetical protein